MPRQLWGEAETGQREEQSPPASWEPPRCRNPPSTTTPAPSWQSSLGHRTRHGHAVQPPLTLALQQPRCPASEVRRELRSSPTRSPIGGDRRALCGKSAPRGSPGPPAAPLEGVRSAQEQEVQALVSAPSPFEVMAPGARMAGSPARSWPPVPARCSAACPARPAVHPRGACTQPGKHLPFLSSPGLRGWKGDVVAESLSLGLPPAQARSLGLWCSRK